MIKNNQIEDIATLKADVSSLKISVARIENKLDIIPEMFNNQKLEADKTYVRKEELSYIIEKIKDNQTEINGLWDLVKKYGPQIVVVIATILGVKFL